MTRGVQCGRCCSGGTDVGEPAFASELELLRFARASGLEVLHLGSRREQVGVVLVGGVGAGAMTQGKLDLVRSLASLAVAVVAARDSSARGAMKDPRSSAYTFAYFVDVAGREIDMARRHGRRFSIATIVCRETPTRIARSAWVISPETKRWYRTRFSMASSVRWA